MLFYGWSWKIEEEIYANYMSIMLHPSDLPKFRGGSPIQNQILNLLNQLQDKYDLSFIFISHDMKIIQTMADYIIVLKNGKIVEEGEADSIFNFPKEEYTQKLLQSII